MRRHRWIGEYLLSGNNLNNRVEDNENDDVLMVPAVMTCSCIGAVKPVSIRSAAARALLRATKNAESLCWLYLSHWLVSDRLNLKQQPFRLFACDGGSRFLNQLSRPSMLRE